MQHLTILRAIAARFPADTSISDKVKATLTRIETEASGLLDILKNPDPEKSAMAIDRIVNDEKGRLRDLLAKTRNELTPLIANWRASADAERVKRGNLVPDAFAGETRAVFRAMSLTEKMHFMANATANLDGASIAAILNVPHVLSGLTPEQAVQLRESYLSRSSKSSAPIADEMSGCVETFLGAADALAAPSGAAKPLGTA